MEKQISFVVNEKKYNILVDVRESLLEVLRGKLGLTGTKEGCGVGECGACTTIVDGDVIDSCIYLAVWVDGKNVTTIEGIADCNGKLSDVQESFVESGAVQCGFCTPGLVLATTAFLNKNPKPDKLQIKRGLSGNLCRCTGYTKIIDAVEKTVDKR